MVEPFMVLLLFLLFYLVFVKFLKVNEPIRTPELHHSESKFIQSVVKSCSILHESYQPPWLWGKCGHVQTMVYTLSHVIPRPEGVRHHILMSDGATCYFDVFEATRPHDKGDYTVVVYPGIANSSENTYIRNVVHCAQSYGYRVAVLNHLGALETVPITSPRIFSYGHTEEFGAMIEKVLEIYPETALLGVGFSLGANLLMKYMGESKTNQAAFMCAISVCQGYDAKRAIVGMVNTIKGRLYNLAVTMNILRVLKRHKKALFTPSVCDTHDIDPVQILGATCLETIDEFYSRKIYGFSSHEEYYDRASSCYYINNVDIPVLLINSRDDPLVHDALLEVPKKYAVSHDKALYVLTQHGGHLGYYEGGIVIPRSTTPWYERVLMQYLDAIIDTARNDPANNCNVNGGNAALVV